MRAGVAISSIGHAVVLGWGLIAFAPAAFDTPPAESMPVDLVPITDLTQLQAGNKDAPKKEATAPLPPKREAPPKPKTPPAAKTKQREFNPDQIAALLDRRQPNMARASETPSQTGAFGASTGNAPRLTQSEIDALRAQIQACWNPPVGAADAQDLIVRVRVQFRTDGTLSADPQLVNRGSSPYFQVAAESAMRAVRRCQPYTLPAAKYEIWRDVEVTFDPRDMFGG